MGRYALALVVLAVLVFGLGRWVNSQRQAASADTDPVTTPANSDYYLEDATLYQLSKNGELAYRAHTEQALHFPNEAARLERINVTYVRGLDRPWHIEAEKGRMPAGAHDIYLYDGIVATHVDDKDQTVRVTTDHAWVRPDRDQIDSDAHVTARRPGERIEGDGLLADLATDTIHLLDNVQARYAP